MHALSQQAPAPLMALMPCCKPMPSIAVAPRTHTSSAETLISFAFSSASCLMNLTICSIWRSTYACAVGMAAEGDSGAGLESLLVASC